MTGSREALIIATGTYDDPQLRELRAPAQDATALARVLHDAEIGGFQVKTIIDQPASAIYLGLQQFFDDRALDDLMLVHLSCHGVKDDDGRLYFAAKNTEKRWLESTGVPAEFLKDRMERCRARSIILLLDCCYSGAFLPGAKGDDGVHLKEKFEGHGRAILTASNSIEYSWEGDDLNGTGAPSVFTAAIVEGLETGEADRDQDGNISIDDLYTHVYEKVHDMKRGQTPTKWELGVARDLYIAKNPHPIKLPTPSDRPEPKPHQHDTAPTTRAGSILLPLVARVDHAKAVQAMAFSPDGHLLVSASNDKTVISEAETGTEVRTLFRQDYPQSVVFSPDGRLLATTSSAKGLRLWDASTLKEVLGMIPSVKPNCFAFSPDGQVIAAADTWRPDVSVLSISPNEEAAFSIPTGDDGVYAMAFSPDGKLLAIAGRVIAQLLEISTGRELKQVMLDNSKWVGFSPNGAFWAVSAMNRSQAWLLETATGEAKMNGIVDIVAFSPDGQLVASGGYKSLAGEGSDRRVQLWDLRNLKEVARMMHEGFMFAFQAMQFSPSGRLLATCGSEKIGVRVWRIPRGDEAGRILHKGVKAIAFSPDGHLLASAGGKSVQVWDSGLLDA